MEYRESDKTMFIESEILMIDIPTVAIWRDRIRSWGPPYDSEPISEQKQTEILQHICAALKWRNTQVEIHSQATGWIKGWLE